MRVVNLKNEPYTVYIGRPGHGEDGILGNPVRVNSHCDVCGHMHTERGETLPCFEKYLRNRLQSSSAFRRVFMALDDEDVLGCFCKPNPCHGDIIVKVWREMNEQA